MGALFSVFWYCLTTDRGCYNFCLSLCGINGKAFNQMKLRYSFIRFIGWNEVFCVVVNYCVSKLNDLSIDCERIFGEMLKSIHISFFFASLFVL